VDEDKMIQFDEKVNNPVVHPPDARKGGEGVIILAYDARIQKYTVEHEVMGKRSRLGTIDDCRATGPAWEQLNEWGVLFYTIAPNLKQFPGETERRMRDTPMVRELVAQLLTTYLPNAFTEIEALQKKGYMLHGMIRLANGDLTRVPIMGLEHTVGGAPWPNTLRDTASANLKRDDVAPRRELLRQAIGLAYTKAGNEHKELDYTLADAIVESIGELEGQG
jgi:hypothetical protein